MRPAKTTLDLKDDLDFKDFLKAFEANLLQLKKSPLTIMNFGPRSISKADYIKSCEWLLNILKADPSGETFKTELKKNFEIMEVYGGKHWGEVLITSYYEGVISGSRKKTSRFSRAIYAKPKDLIKVDLKAFVNVLPNLKSLSELPETKNFPAALKGRQTQDLQQDTQIVPYFDRADIDSKQALSGKNLELAWADPIDVFFLQIQGSGVIVFPDGKEMHIGYAEQNGHSYSAIGKFLFNVIPKEKITLQSIEKHLRSLPALDAQKILDMNRSYIFFKKLNDSAQTFFGTEAVAGRTIATDGVYFPKGTLAFMEFQRPEFGAADDIEPNKWTNASRFILDQDTGGAIKGTDHIDLFWGKGISAKQSAGVMKNPGKLYYFVPRADFIRSL